MQPATGTYVVRSQFIRKVFPKQVELCIRPTLNCLHHKNMDFLKQNHDGEWKQND